MTDQIVIDEFVGHIPPIYRGHVNGRPIKVTLDSSAIMKLGSDARDSDPITFLASKRDDVAKATQRVIALRQFNTSMDELAVTLSALDLD